jgi:peptidoglycan/xylan/chitin deacetylase (PgdA/CDA1 family)
MEELMKKMLIVLILFAFVLSACSNVQVTPDKSNVSVVEATISPTLMATLEPVMTATEVVIPTVLPTVIPVPDYVVKLRQIMVDYGRVDEKYLSQSYWDNVSRRVDLYGPAKRILPLEFHGDNYSMFDGAYEKSPASFEKDMRYLVDNDYHFVTGPELVGYLEGWLVLPARSIILTTDSGAGSHDSFERIINLFQVLEREYGASPHMLSYIWTFGITEEESIRCKNDACWEFLRDALDSEYFSFGSHTETHRHFDELTLADTKWDLTTASDEIYENLGVNVYGISWPFESCSPFIDGLHDLGYKYAFGGWTRETLKLFVYPNDDKSLCLPRVFPPNSGGQSSRPLGMTLVEMLDRGMNDYLPLGK